MKSLKLRTALLIFLLLCFFTVNNNSQVPNDDEPIKVNTLLLNLPVIATDKNGRNITGLQKEDFIITQNGENVPIEFFASEDAPLNVAIIVDTSGSTTPLLGNIKDAARAFLKVLRPEDRAMVVSFDGQFMTLCELTSNQRILNNAVDNLALIQMSSTTMYDAIDDVITKKFAQVKGRKAIILLTDSMAVGTQITGEELKRTLSESDTVIYPILFLQSQISRDPWLKTRVDYLGSVASITAGKIYGGGSKLQEAFQNIADDMKGQYLIGFYPEKGNSNNIAIKVNRENVLLRTKKTIRLRTSAKSN
jgi:VWFA-related protein